MRRLRSKDGELNNRPASLLPLHPAWVIQSTDASLLDLGQGRSRAPSSQTWLEDLDAAEAATPGKKYQVIPL